MLTKEQTMDPLQQLMALEQQAIKIGFNWPDMDTIIDQALSECEEIRQSIQGNEGNLRLQEEVGDLIHAAISLCVFAHLDVDQVFMKIVHKFKTRLEALQTLMKKRGYASLEGQSFSHMLELWNEAKLMGLKE